MSGLLASAQARLLARAIYSGLAAFAAFGLAADRPLSTAALAGAALAALHAAVEYVTPLNALIGLFKDPPA